MDSIEIDNPEEVREAIENFDIEEFMNVRSCDFEYKVASNGIITFYPFPLKKGATIIVYPPSIWFGKYERIQINWVGCGEVDPIETGLFGECLSYAALVAQEIDKHFDKIIDVTEKEEVTG